METQNEPDREALQQSLGHSFADPDLLNLALCHSSYVNENLAEELASNERLEFLGDAVIELCVSELLYSRFAQAPEGLLSKARSSMVNERRLAKLARSLALGEYLLLGKGEELQNGRDKQRILADALEALMGAVYLDGGLEAAREVVAGQFGPLIPEKLSGLAQKDYKTRLQEAVQQKLHITPVYRLMGAEGPDHAKVFTASLSVSGRELAQGKGKSKKEAEQDAARRTLEELEANGESEILALEEPSGQENSGA